MDVYYSFSLIQILHLPHVHSSFLAYSTHTNYVITPRDPTSRLQMSLAVT